MQTKNNLFIDLCGSPRGEINIENSSNFLAHNKVKQQSLMVDLVKGKTNFYVNKKVTLE